MSSKIVNISIDDLLKQYKEEHFVLEIFNDDVDDGSGIKRKLTNTEKHKIFNTYFSRYLIQFFQDKGREKNHFLFGKIKLVKKNEKPYIHWYDKGFLHFDMKVNMITENVEPNLIFNLTSNYEKENDVDALEHYSFLKNKN